MVPRASHAYDLARIEQRFVQTFKRESGLRVLMLPTTDGRAIAERSQLSADRRRLAAMASCCTSMAYRGKKYLDFIGRWSARARSA